MIRDKKASLLEHIQCYKMSATKNYRGKMEGKRSSGTRNVVIFEGIKNGRRYRRMIEDALDRESEERPGVTCLTAVGLEKTKKTSIRLNLTTFIQWMLEILCI